MPKAYWGADRESPQYLWVRHGGILMGQQYEGAPSVLSARCCRNDLSSTGLVPISRARALSATTWPTMGSSHCRIASTYWADLSPNNSKNGQKYPMRARVVTICWAISNDRMNEPHVSCVAEPFGPMAVFPGNGRVAESVFRFWPKRNSEAASRVNRLYKSWASQARPAEVRDDRMDRVRAVCFSNMSKSEMRSLEK